jgi:hypothetical protein
MKTAVTKRHFFAPIFLASAVVSTAGCSNRQKAEERGSMSAKPDAGAAVAPAKLVQGPLAPLPAASGSASAASSVAPALPAAPPGNATETILAGMSADCLACARALTPQTGCNLSAISCEELAEGKPRQQCLDTLRCVLPGTPGGSCVNKANSDLTKCYCGGATVEACLAPGTASGVCKKHIEAGLGTTDPGFVARNITNTEHTAGVAMRLVQCLADAGRLLDPKCRACF